MLKRMKKARLGAWCGFAALFVQVVLPVHLVFDIVEAGTNATVELARSVDHYSSGRPPGALSNSQNSAPHHHRHGHDGHCPISLAQLHATTAFTLPAVAMPPRPSIGQFAATVALENRELASASAASYSSRAPPRPSIG
jgi:hypothetical protein